MTPPEDKAPDMPCCAHLRVTERHEENGGFVTRTWWECELCRLEFTPLPPQSPDQGAVNPSIWKDEALTLAHNIITQEIDRINADDGSTEAMNALMKYRH